jgi:hypothetical protein
MEFLKLTIVALAIAGLVGTSLGFLVKFIVEKDQTGSGRMVPVQPAPGMSRPSTQEPSGIQSAADKYRA